MPAHFRLAFFSSEVSAFPESHEGINPDIQRAPSVANQLQLWCGAE